MSESDSTPAAVEYKEIPGTVGKYRIGTDGTFWSRWRNTKQSGQLWSLRKGGTTPKGYTLFYIRINGRNTCKYLHHLVLETFIGPRPENMECRHLNGNPHDNRLENLRWGTYEENRDDMRRHGRHLNHPRGEKSGRSVLTEAQVLLARSEAARGIPTKITAIRLGVSYTTLLGAVTGQSWAWLPNAIAVGRGRKGIFRIKVRQLLKEKAKAILEEP